MLAIDSQNYPAEVAVAGQQASQQIEELPEVSEREPVGICSVLARMEAEAKVWEVLGEGPDGGTWWCLS